MGGGLHAPPVVITFPAHCALMNAHCRSPLQVLKDQPLIPPSRTIPLHLFLQGGAIGPLFLFCRTFSRFLPFGNFTD